MTQIDGDTLADEGSAIGDRGLRIFVAAVDLGSLTRAAERFGIGQPAASHAIRRLESGVGVTLLERTSRGVSPTPAGLELHRRLSPAYAEIDDAVAELRPEELGPVAVSVSTSLATWWLLPRLADFKRDHPDVALRLVTADTDGEVSPADVDLWIPLGIADDTATFLSDEELVPVAHPELADRIDRQRLDLAPLLHLEERYRARFDWNRWFDHHDMTVESQLPGDRSTDYSLVVQAALDGQGVALGWRHIVADLLADGRLVALGEGVVTEHPFRIVTTSRRPNDPGVVAFRDWLVAAFSA